MTLRQFRRRRELEADLAFDDFAQRRVFGRKFFERFDESAIAAFELFHPARYHIDEHIRISHDLECGSDVFVSHDGEGPCGATMNGRNALSIRKPQTAEC